MGNIQYLYKHIKLPKLGMVKTRNSLVPQGRILNATVSQEPSGKYYVSLCCTDIEMQLLPETGRNIGIDLGVRILLYLRWRCYRESQIPEEVFKETLLSCKRNYLEKQRWFKLQ